MGCMPRYLQRSCGAGLQHASWVAILAYISIVGISFHEKFLSFRCMICHRQQVGDVEWEEGGCGVMVWRGPPWYCGWPVCAGGQANWVGEGAWGEGW